MIFYACSTAHVCTLVRILSVAILTRQTNRQKGSQYSSDLRQPSRTLNQWGLLYVAYYVCIVKIVSGIY